ncbi:MAG: biotin transporter BioY [Microbacterium sp.]
MSTSALRGDPLFLADVRRAGLAGDVLLVLGGTAFITLSAFAIIPLPFTPVPITLATFAVLLTGASLGPLRGALSAALYLIAGAVGAPIFSDGQSGLLLPTLGYVVGYVVAAAVAGGLARRRADRHVGRTLALGVVGTLTLYACGAPWLALSAGLDAGQALLLGVVPFLVGDALKILALGALLPSAWRLVGASARQGRGEGR